MSRKQKQVWNLDLITNLLVKSGYQDVENRSRTYGYIEVINGDYDVEIYADGRVMISNDRDDSTDAEGTVTLDRAAQNLVADVLDTVNSVRK